MRLNRKERPNALDIIEILDAADSSSCLRNGEDSPSGLISYSPLHAPFVNFPLFGWAYQHGLSDVEQCFSLTAKQPQPAYKPKKQPAEQGLYCLRVWKVWILTKTCWLAGIAITCALIFFLQTTYLWWMICFFSVNWRVMFVGNLILLFTN
jgi:hypothetical protein